MKRECLNGRPLSDIEFDPERTYIGRPSAFGNPYKLGIDGDRERVIVMYRAHLIKNPELLDKIRAELPGQVLVCHCKLTEACHGDVILEVLNGRP